MTDSLDRLYASVVAARAANPDLSRTSRLFRAGMPKIAKKLAEEAVEVGLEAMQMHRDEVILESADLLYHLCVLWAECEVRPSAVAAELIRRERTYGIAEKLHKKRQGAPQLRLAVATPHPMRARKR
jgi:phosphoribosyl-ATP pyrophosphohydrolase